ncbi:MAG: hypothetical protein LBB76_03165 [Azoarcus sp.]|nr:hypothetical protein [Azoarcus sp.]
MKAKPGQPLVNDNWQEWWSSRHMHGRSDLTESIRAWNGASNQDIVNGWLAAEDTLTFSEFDEATNTWEFGIIMCSENYEEILPLLVFCESISQYKLFSPHDFAIIYPYFWGDSNVMAYMTDSQEGFVLSLAESVTDVAKDHLDYAASRLGEKWEKFEEKFTSSLA